jgi:hypothetical protein
MSLHILNSDIVSFIVGRSSTLDILYDRYLPTNARMDIVITTSCPLNPRIEAKQCKESSHKAALPLRHASEKL